MSVRIIMPTLGNTELSKVSIETVKKSVEGRSDVTFQAVGREASTWADAINVGLKARVRGENVVIMDDDVVVDPGWLEAFEEGVKAGADIVGARLRYPNGLLQHAGTTILMSWGQRPINFGLAHVGRNQPAGDDIFMQPSECPYVTFSLCYLTEDIVNRVGLVDCDYYREGLQYEDADYCFRAKEVGGTIMYWPKASGVHHETQGKRAEFGGRRVASMTQKNHHRFMGRWFYGREQ